MNQKKIALLLTAALAFFHGIFMIWVRTAQVGEDVLFTYFVAQMLLGLFMVFLWLRGDEIEFRYRRSALMNMGIAAIALIFIPVYLYRTRPPGRKAKAIAWCFLCIPASFVCAFAGGVVGALFLGLPKS